MRSALPILFRSSGRPGYLELIAADPHHVRARKLAREVQVRFASSACTVDSREGVVQAKPGDAIITGIGGEQWRVSHSRFADKYQPIAPVVLGQPGRYLSRRYVIQAVPMRESFEVVLADGESRLHGQIGDWLVDYGDGSLGVVSPAAFATTYEIINL